MTGKENNIITANMPIELPWGWDVYKDFNDVVQLFLYRHGFIFLFMGSVFS